MARLAFSCVVLFAISCGDGDSAVSWVFRFEDPTLADRAAFVRARVLEGGCTGSSAVVWEGEIGEGPRGDGAPALSAGRYGLWGRARDASCQWFASGCRDVTLPADDGATLEVVLHEESEQAACPAGACDAGSCRMDAIVTVAAGRAHSCAVEVSGAVLCWGRNDEGELGNGTTVQSSSPVAVSDLGDAVDVAVGGNAVGWQSHSCAIVAPDRVWCWGFNQFGELGDGTTAERTTPVQVMGISAPHGISVGDLHSCVVRLTDARVLCWGANDRGQLGDGTTESAPVPIEVSGVGDVVQVAAGFEHTCARTQAGAVYCWGANEAGQLGDGTTTDRTAAVRVGGTGRALDVGAGGTHTCAVREVDPPRTVWCWGANDYGQLGDGSTTPSPAPVQVTGLAGALQVRSGSNFTCALIDDGTVQCWGYNAFGALGDGTRSHRSTPAPVSGIDDAIDLSAGNSHACAVRANGEVWCWGRNQFGRLGDGTMDDADLPVRAL